MVNYYDILKVSPKASRAEIKSAYRRLARKLHPDRNNGSEETALKFAAIAEAYEILGNAKERVKYDRRSLKCNLAVRQRRFRLRIAEPPRKTLAADGL